MISGQLGTAQLGLTQLGEFSEAASGGIAPPSGPSTVVNSQALAFVVLPNYYELMGQWPLKGER